MGVKLPPLLVVDDEKNMRLSLEAVMAEEGYEIRAVDSAEAALRLLEQEEFFMIITDARLNGMSGYEFLGQLKQRWPNLPVLMITAFATPKLAVEAIKAGAIDYLAKPFAPEELLHAVARCAERHRLILENQELRARAGEPYRLDQIIGESPGPRAAAIDPDRGADQCHRVDPGRKRHGQGIDRRRPSHFEPAERRSLRSHQLRGYS